MKSCIRNKGVVYKDILVTFKKRRSAHKPDNNKSSAAVLMGCGSKYY